jgi:hypothetical protein
MFAAWDVQYDEAGSSTSDFLSPGSALEQFCRTQVQSPHLVTSPDQLNSARTTRIEFVDPAQSR